MISLQNRMLASYLFLMVATVGGIVLALFVTTASTLAPPESTYQRLSPLVSTLDFERVISQTLASLLQGMANDLPPGAPSTAPNENTDRSQPPITQGQSVGSMSISSRYDYYDQQAIQHEVRVLEFEIDSSIENIIQVKVKHDNLGNLQPDTRIRLRLDDWTDPTKAIAATTPAVYGSFSDGGQQWLFSGEAFIENEVPYIRMVADVRPTLSLQDVLLDFGPTLITPLVQAMVIGAIIAFVLSTLISRTIAYPLREASAAATAIAEGDLSKRVPITGPGEVRSVGRAFNHMAQEVEKTQQSQRDLLANVSHDLKTPLTSIQGYAQAIMDGAARNPSGAAEIIYEEAVRLTRMVTRLTELARLQSGQLPMNMERIDLQFLIESLDYRLRVTAENEDIHMTVSCTEPAYIMGDGDRLVQILDNLVGNAIKYTPEGGEVIVQTRNVEGGVFVDITDTGIGIPVKDLPRIFERFYQVDKARGPSRGTGLGLAITYEIVQAHGGQITVDSDEGKGTTFTVWFPVIKQKAEPELVPVM